ncbi:LuxR C-terminal-related transcriptional regulator [Geodermatophilus sp. SYSU D00758]
MTGEHLPLPAVPPALALPVPRRPVPPAVRPGDRADSPLRERDGPVPEQRQQGDGPGGAVAAAALNSRDLEVLRCLGQGRSTTQIASTLSVSRNTARTRIRRVQAKLAVDGRAAAVQAARDLGVLAVLPRCSAVG